MVSLLKGAVSVLKIPQVPFQRTILELKITQQNLCFVRELF